MSTAMQRLLCRYLRLTGPIPRHVGFIMDGNRRYARKRDLPLDQGHRQGYHKLVEIMHWGLALGVEVITVYAFSIDNFRRPADEVDALFELTERKFADMVEQSSVFAENGVAIQVLGKTSLLPPRIQKCVRRTVLQSCSNFAPVPPPHKSTGARLPALFDQTVTGEKPKMVLNICYCYTSFEEMGRIASYMVKDPQLPRNFDSLCDTNAYLHFTCPHKRSIVADSDQNCSCALQERTSAILRKQTEQHNTKQHSDSHIVNNSMCNQCSVAAYTLPPLELLVRTSGERRLSDFMLWQVAQNDVCLSFLPPSWPEMSLWDLSTSLRAFHEQRRVVDARKPHECVEERIRKPAPGPSKWIVWARWCYWLMVVCLVVLLCVGDPPSMSLRGVSERDDRFTSYAPHPTGNFTLTATPHVLHTLHNDSSTAMLIVDPDLDFYVENVSFQPYAYKNTYTVAVQRLFHTASVGVSSL